MPAFRFKHALLLDRRQSEEDDAQRALADTLRRRDVIEAELAQMQRNIRASKAEMSETLVGRVDLRAVAGVARQSADQQRREREIAAAIAEIEPVIADARERLRSAHQARRTLELLRDRERAAWQQQQNRAEQHLLDEIGARAFVEQSRRRSAASGSSSGTLAGEIGGAS